METVDTSPETPEREFLFSPEERERRAELIAKSFAFMHADEPGVADRLMARLVIDTNAHLELHAKIHGANVENAPLRYRVPVAAAAAVAAEDLALTPAPVASRPVMAVPPLPKARPRLTPALKL